MFRLNRIPKPESGVIPSFENAEMRSVLIGPPPDRTFADTFQSLAVRPAPEIGGFWKLTTVIVKGKITLKSNQIITGVDVEVDHRLGEGGRRSVHRCHRQRDRYCQRVGVLLLASGSLPVLEWSRSRGRGRG